LYPGYAAPARFAEPEVVVTGDLRGETYSAHVVRARIDLAAGVAVTMQVKGYKTHIAAMMALYDESRLKLTRAFEASVNMGGNLGNWELLETK
jgi:hypothetical protein